MRNFLTVLLILLLSAACHAQGKIKTPPLGFHTIDFSSEFWSSLNDDSKLKGKLSGVLTYEDIEKIFVIRCNMSVPGGNYLERTIRASIPPEGQFSIGPVPQRTWRDLRAPFLTIVFETRKGDLGLLTIYPGMTIMELNSRYGMTLTADQRIPANGSQRIRRETKSDVIDGWLRR